MLCGGFRREAATSQKPSVFFLFSKQASQYPGLIHIIPTPKPYLLPVADQLHAPSHRSSQAEEKGVQSKQLTVMNSVHQINPVTIQHKSVGKKPLSCLCPIIQVPSLSFKCALVVMKDESFARL